MKTRKLFSILLSLAIALSVMAMLPVTASAAPVDISADFTDENFRAAVYEHIGKTAPAPIYDTDAANLERLHVLNREIKSLAGLSHFTNLKEFTCSSNQIKSLPQLPSSLIKLDCSQNQLSSLPALPSGLEVLLCSVNKLTSLPALPSSLIRLECGGNKLTSLPALPTSLEVLWCEVNQLTALPVLPASLEQLWCDRNQLTSLPALPSMLKELRCSENQLTAIDVTGLSLERLWCDHNNMSDTSAVIGFAGTWDKAGSGKPFIFAPQNGTAPSFFAKVWAFIVKWILFGWLWNK